MMFVKNMNYKTNETNVAKERLDFLDQARGVGIILVIIGHFYVDGWFTNIIYYFHIPLFFIISGYLSNPNKAPDMFFRKISRQIITYLCLGIPVAAADWFFNTEHSMHNLLKVFAKLIIQRRYSTMWFLACLIVVETLFWLLNYALRKSEKRHHYLVCVCGIICVISSMYIRVINVVLPWNIDLAGYSLGFFCFGYGLRNFKACKKIMSIDRIVGIICSIAVVGSAIIMYKVTGIRFDMFWRLLGYPVVSFVLAIMMSIVLVYGSRIVTIPTLCYIGRNTLLLFAWHQFIFKKIFVWIWGGNPNFVQLLISMIFTVIITLLINEMIVRTKLRFILGK